MDVHDEQPMAHQVGNRTYLVADVDPLDVDGVRTVEVGSAIWLLGFLALLPFYGQLEESGRLWWLWTCLTGFGLGLLGLEYCRRRRRARIRAGDEPDGSGGTARVDHGPPPTSPPTTPPPA